MSTWHELFGSTSHAWYETAAWKSFNSEFKQKRLRVVAILTIDQCRSQEADIVIIQFGQEADTISPARTALTSPYHEGPRKYCFLADGEAVLERVEPGGTVSSGQGSASLAGDIYD
jgi:hypothetical protein